MLFEWREVILGLSQFLNLTVLSHLRDVVLQVPRCALQRHANHHLQEYKPIYVQKDKGAEENEGQGYVGLQVFAPFIVDTVLVNVNDVEGQTNQSAVEPGDLANYHGYIGNVVPIQQVEELGRGDGHVASVVDEHYEDAERNHVAKQVGRCQGHVRDVVKGHLGEVRILLSDEEMCDRLLQRVAKENQPNQVTFAVHRGEGHVSEAVYGIA